MKKNFQVGVIGAGGHAKVVVSTLLAAGYRVLGILDDDRRKHGGRLLGVPLLGPTRDAGRYPGARWVIAIGDNRQRKAVAERLHKTVWQTVVHPNADVHPSVKLGPGTIIFSGAVVQPDAVLGSHVIVNTAAGIDHDCIIADYAHIAPGAQLAGNVSVGEGALLGVGCAVIPGRRIGDWTTVGAGAAVVRNLPGGIVAAGVPARTLRQVKSSRTKTARKR